MGIFDWVRGEKHIPEELPEKPPEAAPASAPWGLPEDWRPETRGSLDRVKQFASLAPEADRVAVMDDSDGGGGGSSMKQMLSSNQPNVSDALFHWFARQGFIGHQMAALVAQNWLVYKACAMPARDAVRNGWRVGTETGDQLAAATLLEITKADKRLGIKKQLREFLTMGRIFGVRIAVPNIDYDDPVASYAAPFNIDGVKPKTFLGWTQIDPYWITPQLDNLASGDPKNPHFYEPTWWVIQGRKYHRSHLVIYRHGMLADILKPAYMYGGIPLPQMIMERVYAAERSANEAPLLALTKRTVVYKTNMEKAMVNLPKLYERVAFFSEMWNNYGMRMIDKEEDEHEQFDTSLGDLDALIMTQYQLVAAVAEVPSVKLLGTSAKGFNATGEGDEASYHESLESIQENDLQAFLDRHYLLLSKSLDMGLEHRIEAFWNPLDAPTAQETAASNLAKAQTGAALVAAGITSIEEERARLGRDEDSGYAGVLNDTIEETTED